MSAHLLAGHSWSHIRLSYVAPVYLNSPNADAVLSLFHDYARLPADILDQVLFVLVDDGSPQSYTLPDLPLNMIVLRIAQDIPWNNPGARNLGVLYARSDRVFVTDIDHQLDERTFRTLLAMPAPGKTLYRLPRISAEGRKIHPHANSFFLSRGYFLQNFGYDEVLCGSYACDDTLFVKYLKYHGARLMTILWGAVARVRHIPSVTGYTHNLPRDMTRNKKIVAQKIADIRAYGAQAGHDRAFLCFDYAVVRVMRRGVPVCRPNRLWWYFWWFRWF